MDNNKSDEKLSQFIDKSLGSKTSKNTYVINEKIPQKLAAAIYQILGVDVSEYKNEIYEDIVRHIHMRHGKFGEADQSMGDMKKLSDIEEITTTFDDITVGEKNRRFKNKDNSYSDTVQMVKKYPKETSYLIEAVPHNKRQALEVVTMYSKNYKEDTKQEPDVKSPSITSETKLANNVSSNLTINRIEASVNERICKDLEQNGFQPTKALVSHMEKLNQLTGNETSIKDVHNIYISMKNPEIQDVVNKIANECRVQELEKQLLLPGQ